MLDNKSSKIHDSAYKIGLVQVCELLVFLKTYLATQKEFINPRQLRLSPFLKRISDFSEVLPTWSGHLPPSSETTSATVDPWPKGLTPPGGQWLGRCFWCRVFERLVTVSKFDIFIVLLQTWTASVHALHMPKPVITFVFKVLRNGLLRYILYTCPNL